ncbi:MAG: hypothetical protein ACYC61_07810 [Isosphaeraceae bacterium]
MRSHKRVKAAFRPSMIDSSLEDRVVLSSGAAAAGTPAAVYQLKPSPVYAELGLTPPPAAPPISAALARELAAHNLPVNLVHTAFRQQIHLATQDLRSAVQSQIAQLYANGSTPTTQQLANFRASIAGALNATTLRVSTQAALLPRSSHLMMKMQTSILGNGANSLASRLNNLAESGRLSGTTAASTRALSNLFSNATRTGVAKVNGYFAYNPVNALSVNANRQRIPLEQYMGSQLVHQLGNTLGLLAQSYPNVANAMLYGDANATGAPTPAAQAAFNAAYNNAINTAAYQLGSGLSLFPLNSSIVSQLAPLIYGGGSTGTTTGTITTGTTGNSVYTALASIPDYLQNLLAGNPTGALTGTGTTAMNTAIENAFGNVYNSLASPISTYFGVTTPANLTLPINGFNSLFASPYVDSSYYNGFNNGFSSGTTPGFIGFGMAPTTFNTSFGTGFNNYISTFNERVGLIPQLNPVTSTNVGGSIISNPVSGASPSNGASVGQGNPGLDTNPGTGTTGLTPYPTTIL